MFADARAPVWASGAPPSQESPGPMKRFLIGALAVVGALSILFFCGLLALLVIGATASRPTVPGSVVLEWEIDQPLVEAHAEDSLAAAFGGHKTTVRDVVDALERAGDDARVKGLLVRVTTAPGGAAAVQELRDAVRAFRQKGKRAVAYADSFGEFSAATGAYYFATAFDEVYIQPSGDVGLTGLAQESPFVRDALAKLGVKPRIGQRYEYKNAVNTFTEQGYNAPHREATEKYLTSLFNQMVRGIAEGRKLTEAQVRALVDRGPLLGKEALDAKLVDGLLYRDEVHDKVKKAAGNGDDVDLLFVDKYLGRAGRPHTRGPTVALIYGVGQVVRGEGEGNPLSDDASLGGDRVARAFRKAVADEDVEAIVFRVDSPGGSYIASDTVRREVQRAREAGKPVIVSMGGLAASGGYFVSMDADKIVAQPGTLTGSIGVFGGKMVTEELWAKLGVNWDTVKVGQNADLMSTDRDYSAEQQKRVDAMLDRIYQDFTAKAAAGRKLPLEKLQAVAKGRVWTGEDARALGLVDTLGGFPEAFRLAREAAGLKPDADYKVEVFPRPQTPAQAIAELLSGEEGDNSESASRVSPAAVRALAPLQPLVDLAARLGLTRQAGVLEAPVAEPQW